MNTITELKNKIVAANKAYRAGNAIMTDIEWDNLLEDLQKMVPDNEYKAFRETLMERDGKIVHPYAMGSLSKFKHEEPANLCTWINEHVDTALNISAKVDGISCRLHYSNGQLESGTTRGDGHKGEDISDKIKFVKEIPITIDVPGEVDIRGELVIFETDFEALSNDFANPRNATAGIMNRKDWSPKQVANVSFVAYTIFGTKFTKKQQFEVLERNKFCVAWHKSFTIPELQIKTAVRFEDFNNELRDYAKQKFRYGTDGLVLSDDDYVNEDVLIPENQIAYKINELSAQTVVVDIDWRGPSKDGKYVPVAQLEPIELGGSVVSQCTLHNLDFIKKMGIKFGSKIEVLKSGDIIPKCVRLIENPPNAVDITYPTHCECCGEELIVDGVDLRCVNKDCDSKQLASVTLFIKKFGVKHSAKKQLDNFKIKTIADLVKFLPNPAYKSETTLYNEINEKIFTASPKKIFCSMNFKGLGEIQLAKIVDKYGLKFIMDHRADFTDVSQMTGTKLLMAQNLPDGIGLKSLDTFFEYVLDAIDNTFLITLDSRYKYDESKEASKTVATAPTKGSICFTGALETLSRNEAQTLASESGFEVKGGVTKGLTYLVIANPNSNSSKARKARELGTKLLSEKEFLAMCKNEQQNLDDL